MRLVDDKGQELPRDGQAVGNLQVSRQPTNVVTLNSGNPGFGGFTLILEGVTPCKGAVGNLRHLHHSAKATQALRNLQVSITVVQHKAPTVQKICATPILVVGSAVVPAL